MSNERINANILWKRQGLWHMVLFLLQLGMLYSIVVFLKNNPNQWLYLYALGLGILTMIANVVLLIMRYIRQKKELLQKKIQEYEFLEQISRRRQLTQQELEEETRRLENSLQMELEGARSAIHKLKGEPDGEAINRFLEQAGGKWDWGYCANAIANVVLKEKSAECSRQHIRFEVDASIPMQVFVSDYHLCSLLSNLLDNAMEACMALPEEKRRINVKSAVQKGCFYLQIVNTSTKEYVNRPGREGRGQGTGIVAGIVEQYGGEQQAEYKDGMYAVDVMLAEKI